MAVSYSIPSSTTNFSGYSHVIGSTDFDADMVTIEMFVRSYSQPANVLAQSAVFNYYMAQLLFYWDFTMDYATSDKIETDIAANTQIPVRKNKFSSDEMTVWNTQFQTKIEELQADFGRTFRVNIVQIGTLFIFIAKVACLQDPNSKIIYEFRPQFYPLPNIGGLFGLNTYLYAYFEGILLVGVPTTSVSYDKIFNCPELFIVHDLAHNINIEDFEQIKEYTGLDRQKGKRIYYTILNDPGLSSLHRKNHITNLWVCIHEFGSVFRITERDFGYFLLRQFEHLYAATGDDFYELYRSFDIITLTFDNTTSLLSLVPGSRSLRNIEDTINNPEPSFGKYFLLSYWSTLRYLSSMILL